jgi:hypothetical protein
MRQADVFADRQLRGDEDAIATVSRATAAVIGIIDLATD